MKEILNKTARPLRVPLPQGKVLHLGPRMTARISDGAAAQASIQKLVEEGAVEILEEGDSSRGAKPAGPGAATTRGHGGGQPRRSRGER